MAKKAASTIFSRITDAYLILMATIYLLYIGGSGFAGITGEKYHLFLLLCGGYAAIMLLLLAENAIVSAKHIQLRATLKNTGLTQRLIAVYLLLTWVSTLISPYFPQTIVGVSRYEGALTITIYCLCFFLVCAYGRISKPLIAAFAAAVTLFDLLCIVQLYGGNPFTLYPVGYCYADAGTAYSGAYLGTIGNVDLVAAFFCLAIPTFWAVILRSRDRQRWLLTLPLVLSLFVLVKMDVLAGFVGVFGGAIMSLVVIIPMEKRIRCYAAWGLLAAAVLAIITLYCFDFGGLFYEVHSILHGNAESSFGSGRLHIWQCVIERIPEHLLFGTGPDTMLYGELEAFSRYDASLGGKIVAQIDVAHNEYLNILYHQGIFAAMAYLGALVAAAKKWLTSSARSARTAVLGTMLLCYSIQAFFGFSMVMTAPYFYLTLALFDKSDM